MPSPVLPHLPLWTHFQRTPGGLGAPRHLEFFPHQYDSAVGCLRTQPPCRFLKQPDWTVSSIDTLTPKQGCDFLSPSKPNLEDGSDPLTVNET